MDAVRAIADAVLYEGYVLWPYRRSALKNQQRWTFGGVFPRPWAARHPDDPSRMRTECLLEADGDADVTVRFLHVVARDVEAGGRRVEEAWAGGERLLSWEEATERELRAGPFSIPAGEAREDAGDGVAVVRRWAAIDGEVEVERAAVGDGLTKVAVEIRNTTPWDGEDRREALRRTCVSTHTTLRGGPFVSLTDPPERCRPAAAACVNAGTWPVLVGEPGSADTVLSSPIILEDHPRIAPESPGDLFDGGEIDQLLVLSILTLTDDEKAEMRDSDPRTREILERTEALTSEELLRLHGAIREFGLARRP